MDLTKKIVLHYGTSPVQGEDEAIQRTLLLENEFCAVFVPTDVPVEVHHETNDSLIRSYGVHSLLGKKTGQYVRPYIIDRHTSLATARAYGLLERATAKAALRGTPFRVGGMFFNLEIADAVVQEFERQGYEIEKKFDSD